MGISRVNLLVPMSLRILIERSEHYGQDHLNIITDKITEIFIVPEVQRAFGDLPRVSQK